MGNTFTIEVWVKQTNTQPGDPAYAYEEYWRGESAWQCFKQLRKAKRDGHGCVTLHWRGSK